MLGLVKSYGQKRGAAMTIALAFIEFQPKLIDR